MSAIELDIGHVLCLLWQSRGTEQIAEQDQYQLTNVVLHGRARHLTCLNIMYADYSEPNGVVLGPESVKLR